MNKISFFPAFLLFLMSTLHGQDYMLTQRGNNERSGTYFTSEKILNTTNVNVDSFGLLYAYPLDGQEYAQPLYVPGIKITGIGIRNVLFLATEHNSVYAYDADSLTAPLWHDSLGPSCPVPDPSFGFRYGPYGDIKTEVGITSTPVIDTSTNTLYALAFSKENDNYYHKLYAIDLSDGSLKFNSPVTISTSVKGTGDGNVDGVISFTSNRQLQRSALVLSNGIIYIAFAGYADTDPYHGWVLGYTADSLKQKYVFNDTPNGAEGGIWMSGQGASVDENGDLYYATGNGDFDADTGGADYGDSFIKLHPAGDSLTVTDYFTPYNQAFLQNVDGDLGVDAPVMIPNSDMLVGGGKLGQVYVVNKTDMGKYNTSACKCDSQIYQSFYTFDGILYGSFAYWEGNDGGYLIGWSADDKLQAFKRNGNEFINPPSSIGNYSGQRSGGILTITSNDTVDGTAIVWANMFTSLTSVSGVLRAFDARDMSKELWNSRQNAFRDAFGDYAKFNAPIVIRGKVYEPTFSKQLVVYGLNPPVKYLEADNPAQTNTGLNYYYFSGNYTSLPNFPLLKADKADSTNNVTLTPFADSTNYAVTFRGYINISQKGQYTFYLNSQDGSYLTIGNYTIIDNNGVHGPTELHGSIGLLPGKHAIAVSYFRTTGNAALNFSYASDSFAKMPVPDSVLFRGPLQIKVSGISPVHEPDYLYLGQNVPNPATGMTRIEFGVDHPERVIITLYRLDGEMVKTLFDGRISGKSAVELNTKELDPGIYVYKMTAGNEVLSKKIWIR